MTDILTDEQRQQYQEALAADARARDEIRTANDEAIKTALSAITGLASFKTLMDKLAEVQKMEGFDESRFAAHVNGLRVTSVNMQDSVK